MKISSRRASDEQKNLFSPALIFVGIALVILLMMLFGLFQLIHFSAKSPWQENVFGYFMLVISLLLLTGVGFVFVLLLKQVRSGKILVYTGTVSDKGSNDYGMKRSGQILSYYFELDFVLW